jgi:hypothetical protein
LFRISDFDICNFLPEWFDMKTKLAINLVMLVFVLLAAALPAQAAIFFRSNVWQGGPAAGGWQDGYYDPAWGMPLAVLVPPTARWQTDYSSTVGSARISHINSRFRPEYPGPQSTYRQGDYLSAPPQPYDTRQMGDYYVRGPRR